MYNKPSSEICGRAERLENLTKTMIKKLKLKIDTDNEEDIFPNTEA